MVLARSRFRSHALFGVFLLLLSGGWDAFGVGRCAFHGSHHAHGAGQPGTHGEHEGDGEHWTHGAHGSHGEHGSHGAHGTHDHSAAHGHEPDPGSAAHGAPDHAHDEDADRCECRLLCMAAATFGAPDPIATPSEEASFAITTGAVPLPAEPGVVALALLPFVLPFAHGPPSHS